MRRLLLLLLFPQLLWAQGTRYDNFNLTSANNTPFGAQAPIYTLPKSTVTVCAYPDDGGQPCGNVIPIYSDPALTQTADNPITADVHGRFGFWLAPGTYTYSVVTQGGLFVGTYIFTLGGSGSVSGCATTGITAGDLLFPNSGGTCLGSDNIQASGVFGGVNGADTLIIKTPSAQAGDDLNIELLSAVDPNHNESDFAPHLWKMTCTNSGTSTLGCQEILHVNDTGASFGGLTPIWVNMTASKSGTHGAYTGIEVDQGADTGVNTTVSYSGINVGATYQGIFGNVYGYAAEMNAGTEAAGEEIGMLIATNLGVTEAANYCDFVGRNGVNAAGSTLHESLGCGSAYTNTFAGNVAAPMYQETLTTPASSSAACTAGQFTDDANYHYVCVATNTWKRVALSSF